MNARAWVTKYSKRAEHYIMKAPTTIDTILQRPDANTPVCVSVYPQFYCSCGAYHLLWNV